VDRAVDLNMKGHRWLAVLVLVLVTACSRVTVCPGLPPPPPFVLGERMPEDFRIALWTYDSTSPRNQLDVMVGADGRADWRVWVPATKRESSSGKGVADAAQVASVWRSVVDARFDTIDEGATSPDVCSGGASGIQRFAVRADGAERYVWRPPGAADVEGIRRAVLAVVPVDVAARFGAGSAR
jgi:hypothetical protein